MIRVHHKVQLQMTACAFGYRKSHGQSHCSTQHMTRHLNVPNESAGSPGSAMWCQSSLYSPATVNPVLSLNSPRVKLLHFPYHPHLPLNFLSPLPAVWTNKVSSNNQPQMCRVLNGDGGVCASSGLLGRFNFHHLSKNVALSEAAITPTGFLWGDSVMRFWRWDLFYMWAHLQLITDEKSCLWICMEPEPWSLFGWWS